MALKIRVHEATSLNTKQLQNKSSILTNKYNKRFGIESDTIKYLDYQGPIDEDILLEAWEAGYQKGGTARFRSHDYLLALFKKIVLKDYLTLLTGNKTTLYRGLQPKKKDLPYILHNLMPHNSWTTNPKVAEKYAWSTLNDGDAYLILCTECTVKDVNLVLSAYLEGLWSGRSGHDAAHGGANDEIVMNKSANRLDVGIFPLEPETERMLEEADMGEYIIDNIEGVDKFYPE